MQYAVNVRRVSDVWVVLIAAALSTPIILFSLLNYDINPVFLLAPLVALAFFDGLGKMSILYVTSLVLGIVSILVVNHLKPDGELVRHFFSLVLIMFAPSFWFLGRSLSRRVGLETIVYWLAVFSSIFVVVVTGRIIALNEQVRIYIGDPGLELAYMNAKFLGWPVFAAFGVLSLAHLICLQFLVVCGVYLARSGGRVFSIGMPLALFSGAFLIAGSDSRSAQALLLWIAATLLVGAWRVPRIRRKTLVVVMLTLLAFLVLYVRGMSEFRMFTTVQTMSQEQPVATGDVAERIERLAEELNSVAPLADISNDREEASTEGLASDEEMRSEVQQREQSVQILKKADQFSTGRLELAIESVTEVSKSPVVGNGFSGYGRLRDDATPLKGSISENSSTHIYYLTLLWKGGLLFFIPFMIMLMMAFHRLWRLRLSQPRSVERIYAVSAVLMAFGPMALAWDILIVPSAGVLAFFLLGTLGTVQRPVVEPGFGVAGAGD
ncbi:O-antigen ligase family protein [Pseudomonas sp. S44]|uniref:O-antigen ligase family protein n=1 Tax=unclassified Pseudomonas TaxID=196821 RepID=UPI00190B64AC|nr:O-antigen ligase family protein [Pseudomonas sp. S44]MBK0060632.1 O-antigen ligase family protein [Pseudomonas sp. S44]